MSTVLRLGASVLATTLLQLHLPNGQSAVVAPNGIAQVFSKDHKKVETQIVRPGPYYDSGTHPLLADKGRVIAQLATSRSGAYEPNRVIVVFREGTFAPRDVVNVEMPVLRSLRAATAKHALASTTVPAYTNDLAVNRALAAIGVDRSERLFRAYNRSVLAALRERASTGGARILDFTNAYRLHVSGASVRRAVATLAKLPQVEYVSPDWRVSPMHTTSIPADRSIVAASRLRAQRMWAPATERVGSSALPSNYAVSASAQSLLNSPSLDAAAAYEEIESRFHQLPGQGETITNVSLGDLDDASIANNPNDPCHGDEAAYGPTTIVQGGQRYLDLPSMPLIPTYTADPSGNLNGTGEVCGVDPYIAEIALDFSMMSPLPHNLQRAGEQGSGQTDLLGVAPGANYRLIVPAEASATNSDVDAAFLAAAMQTPRPDVITASIGFGYDAEGFPSRYFEEDPLSEAIVASIVQADHIVVCISSGDGTRTSTTVAIGPSGGSVPTNLVGPGGTTTSLSDDGYSTIPSEVYDSGSIDVGGTTLDDIFADPPQYATSPATIAQHAYAETRWTGFTSFSTGFGSRVDVSAPSDNVLSFEHPFGGAADAVEVVLQGGTSASAPETAAAAAVLLQVGRLTNHPFSSPLAVRKLLETTGNPVPNVSQADTTLAIGPQVDLRAAVESLVEKAPGPHPTPGVGRVAVEQRRDYADLNGAFLSDTDPSDIDLAGGARPGADQLSWITIAPDWTYVPKQAKYVLFVKGKPHAQLATTAWARLLPLTIFKAAGLSTTSTSSQTAKLVYEARLGSKVVASANVSLTFGPPVAQPFFLLAPKVAPVVTGSTITVPYDLTGVSSLNNPQLVVSEPGRVDTATGNLFHAAYTVPLTAPKGTVRVPVSKLQGGGIYGIGIELDSTNGIYSNFAFTRVSTPKDERPPAPLLSSNGSVPGHYLEIPYGGSFQVQYDVSNVPGATGAKLEISAAGPGAWSNWNPFNNPNGTIRDDNGVDSGSVYFVTVSGKKGTATIANAQKAGLYAALNHVVRVIPMKGSTAAGEGSDVSSVTMDGVFASDGGYANNGFGVNANGTDGFLTSDQVTASGQILTSLESFDQTTNQIVQTIGSGANSLYYTEGWGLYGGDVGLACEENTSTQASTCNALQTVSSGTVGSTWSPPYPSSFFIDEAAADPANDNGAFYGYDLSTDHYQLFASNVAANTFSSLFDISAPLTGFTSPDYWGVAENTTTNMAVLPADDLANPNGPPTIVQVNLTTGATTSFTGKGAFFPYGVAVDSATNKAAVPTLGDDGLTIYDLAAQTGNEVILPQPPNGGAGGLYTMADPTANQFLVEQTTSPDFVANNNSLSRVLVYDESGNLKETIQRFSLFFTETQVQDNELQVNPATRTGYFIGPFQQQLIPFTY